MIDYIILYYSLLCITTGPDDQKLTVSQVKHTFRTVYQTSFIESEKLYLSAICYWMCVWGGGLKSILKQKHYHYAQTSALSCDH